MRLAGTILGALTAAYCGVFAVLILFASPAPLTDRLPAAMVCAALAIVCALCARIAWED